MFSTDELLSVYLEGWNDGSNLNPYLRGSERWKWFREGHRNRLLGTYTKKEANRLTREDRKVVCY